MIRVTDGAAAEVAFETSEAFADVVSDKIDAGSRLEAASGRAVDWQAWFEAWSVTYGNGESKPTHLEVTAKDEFHAVIPWAELKDAFVVYAQADGQPLAKAYPLRLYTPNGSSECLNVKSVVELRIHDDASLGEKATFGFRNVLTPEQLFAGRRSE